MLEHLYQGADKVRQAIACSQEAFLDLMRFRSPGDLETVRTKLCLAIVKLQAASLMIGEHLEREAEQK